MIYVTKYMKMCSRSSAHTNLAEEEEEYHTPRASRQQFRRLSLKEVDKVKRSSCLLSRQLGALDMCRSERGKQNQRKNASHPSTKKRNNITHKRKAYGISTPH